MEPKIVLLNFKKLKKLAQYYYKYNYKDNMSSTRLVLIDNTLL